MKTAGPRPERANFTPLFGHVGKRNLNLPRGSDTAQDAREVGKVSLR